MTTINRRETDSREQHDIDKLIAEENDPKTRLHLMVMNSMNRNLIANTEATNAVATMVTNVSKDLEAHVERFESHTTAEEAYIKQQDAIINKGKGAWQVIAYVIGGVQLIGLGIWGYASAEISDIHTSIRSVEKVTTDLDKRVTVIEKSTK